MKEKRYNGFEYCACGSCLAIRNFLIDSFWKIGRPIWSVLTSKLFLLTGSFTGR